MGTLTKTYTEDHLGYGYTAVNRTLEFTGQDILVTDSTFNIGTITLKGSYSSSVNGRTAVYDRISSLNFIRTGSTIKQSSLNIEQSLAAGAQYTVSYGGFPSQTTSNNHKPFQTIINHLKPLNHQIFKPFQTHKQLQTTESSNFQPLAQRS